MSTEQTKGRWKKFDCKPELTDSRIYRTGVRIGIPMAAYKQRIKDTKSIGGNLIALAFGKTKEECEANASLIAEAGTVLNETGLTHRQLLDFKNELIDTVKEDGNMIAKLALLNKELKEQRDTIELKYNALLLDFGIIVEQRDGLLSENEILTERVKDLEALVQTLETERQRLANK